MFKYHKDGDLPIGSEIFVYGSNLAGIHGAGAAKVAMNLFGAKWGNGKPGIVGLSYAIPTKDERIESLSLDRISPFVYDFVSFTKSHPCIEFFLTRVGCGLAGFANNDIAPLFKGVGENCNIPEEWKRWL